MIVRRRDLLLAAGAGAGLGIAVGTIGQCTGRGVSAVSPGVVPNAEAADSDPASLQTWEGVRAQFRLSPEKVHLSSMFIASHPRPVREAIRRHADALDEDPAGYLLRTNTRALLEVYAEAARFMDAPEEHVALTRSTTEGLALLYNGLKLEPGDKVLVEEGGYYSTWQSLDFKATQSGASWERVPLFDEPSGWSEDEVVARLLRAVDERTRAVALTWVHSDTGVKLPIRAIADALGEVGRRRGRPVLLCVDGVHGFGVESETLGALGCDVFVAGCHKWLYGPRGTGVLYAARSEVWDALVPTVPPFGLRETPGHVMTPGGFHPFEHRWALADAFRFHRAIGQERITARIRELTGQLKEGLGGMRGVRLLTPVSPERSAGIVSFELEGLSSSRAVSRLREEGFVVTQAPYGSEAVRATPGYINTPEEIDRLLTAVREIA